jgi:hypothetical protein
MHRNRQIKTLGPNVLGHAVAHQTRSADKSNVLHVCLWCVVKGASFWKKVLGGAVACAFQVNV